jgi:hypothetical protein
MKAIPTEPEIACHTCDLAETKIARQQEERGV